MSTIERTRRGRPRTRPVKLPTLPADEPWVKQPGELHHDAMTAYVKLPPGVRSLEKCAVVTQVPTGTLAEWSRQWRWPERARAYDAAHMQDGERALAYQHIEIRTMVVDALTPGVRKLVNYIEKLDPETMDVRDLTTAVDKLTNLLLRASGPGTGGGGGTHVTVQTQVNTLVAGAPSSDEQLARILRAVERDPRLRDVVQSAIVGEIER